MISGEFLRGCSWYQRNGVVDDRNYAPNGGSRFDHSRDLATGRPVACPSVRSNAGFDLVFHPV